MKKSCWISIFLTVGSCQYTGMACMMNADAISIKKKKRGLLIMIKASIYKIFRTRSFSLDLNYHIPVAMYCLQSGGIMKANTCLAVTNIMALVSMDFPKSCLLTAE